MTAIDDSPMPDKKHRVTVDLEPEEYQQLSELKHQQERSLAWLGRQAILDYIEKHSPSSPQPIARAPRQESRL